MRFTCDSHAKARNDRSKKTTQPWPMGERVHLRATSPVDQSCGLLCTAEDGQSASMRLQFQTVFSSRILYATIRPQFKTPCHVQTLGWRLAESNSDGQIADEGNGSRASGGCPVAVDRKDHRKRFLPEVGQT